MMFYDYFLQNSEKYKENRAKGSVMQNDPVNPCMLIFIDDRLILAINQGQHTSKRNVAGKHNCLLSSGYSKRSTV